MKPVEIMRVGFVMKAAGIEKDVRITDLTDDELTELLQATLTALENAGMMVVPVEPTEAMLAGPGLKDLRLRIYKDMLAAVTYD